MKYFIFCLLLSVVSCSGNTLKTNVSNKPDTTLTLTSGMTIEEVLVEVKKQPETQESSHAEGQHIVTLNKLKLEFVNKKLVNWEATESQVLTGKQNTSDFNLADYLPKIELSENKPYFFKPFLGLGFKHPQHGFSYGLSGGMYLPSGDGLGLAVNFVDHIKNVQILAIYDYYQSIYRFQVGAGYSQKKVRAYWYDNYSNEDFTMRIGLGIELIQTKNITIEPTIDYNFSFDKPTHITSLGFNFYFN